MVMSMLRPRPLPHPLASKTWTDRPKTMFMGCVPYDNEHLQLIPRPRCKCGRKCICKWDAPNNRTDCECMGDKNAECKGNCGSCKIQRDKGESDNTRILRNGLTPNATTRIRTEKMGDSLRLEQTCEAGDVLIGFVGGNVILKEDMPPEHEDHMVEMGQRKFRLKKDYGPWKKGKVWKGEFVMDCCEYGNDANFVNSTCVNNNAQCYITIVDGLPQSVLYALKRLPSGLNMF